ncbi:MAG: hypothetical protein KC776_34760 [Myxococcales bacterium]|nr:hypothetical protein [Myxococcales bacterium]MCB9581916.1 hypothetical protein [Polyangiaceae bacterium]
MNELDDFGLSEEEGAQHTEFYFDQFPWAGDMTTLEQMLPEEFFALVD